MKKESDVTLSEEVERNWAEITSREYLFNRNEKTINLLENCEKEKMIKQITSIVGTKERRKKLSVQVIGNPDGIKIQSEDNDDEEGDLEELATTSTSCDLDPDMVFEMEYLDCDDKIISPHFIMDANAFKNRLRTYEITRITK